jgi:WD40 repeat protein
MYNYMTEQSLIVLKTMYGALRCAAWSHDGRLLAAGGEDDCIYVWRFDPCHPTSLSLVTRCVGHRSWISRIAFAMPAMPGSPPTPTAPAPAPPSILALKSDDCCCCQLCDSLSLDYRLTSVGQDGMLIVWRVHASTMTPTRSKSDPYSLSFNVTSSSNTRCARAEARSINWANITSSDSAIVASVISPTPCSDLLLLPGHLVLVQSWGGRVAFLTKRPASLIRIWKDVFRRGGGDGGGM